MPITPYTTTPSRKNPSTFSADRDQRFIEENQRIIEANALEVTVKAAEANAIAQVALAAAQVDLAEDQVTLATAQAVLADASADTALAAANYKGEWSSLSGAANMPYAVSRLGKFWQLNTNLADVSAKTPGVDPEWLSISSPPCVLTAKTSSGTLSAGELAGNVTITNTGAGGAIELTLQAGAADYSVEFEVTVAQYLKVTMAGAETCGYGATVGAAGGYVRSNVIGTRWKMTWNGTRWSISDLVGILNADE